MYKPAWHLSGPPPYEVQIEALKRAHDHAHYGFFLEQGLGKTALQLNDGIENFSDYDTVVVVCPNSFKGDWKTAPADWGIPAINTSVWPNEELCSGTTDHPRYNIINFEAIRFPSGYNEVKRLLDSRPCLLVIDESSACKNFKSLTAKALLDLSKRAAAVRLLNGTPMVQNVMDLFPQLKMLKELNGVNPYAFRNRYAVCGGYMGKQVVGAQNEDELHEILNRVSFRALKKDWSDLPDKIFIPRRLEMTNIQKKHYKEMLEDFYTLVEGNEFSANMVLSQADKLRQISSGILMDGDRAKLLMDPSDNPKIKAAKEIYESGPGKMIVVHFYSISGAAIFEEMKKTKLNPAFIKGGMKPDEITEQKRRFNSDPDCRVLVAQITASSKAHTLIGDAGENRCSRMVWHDGTFSLLDRLQMLDRIHRGAQDQNCNYYDLIMSPIDEAQLKALDKKENLADAVVNAVRVLRNEQHTGKYKA